jgi:hypothetical protein
MPEVVRDDRLGQAGAVPADVPDGVVEVVDDADGQDQIEIFRVPVRLGGRGGLRDQCARALAATQLHPRIDEPTRHGGEEPRSHLAMDEQRLERVAHARSLGLGIQREADRHVEVGRGVHEEMDEPLVVLEHGHARCLVDPAHEVLASARDDEVDESVQLQERAHGGAVGRVDELDRRRRRPHLLQGLGQHGRDQRIRFDGFAAAP